MKKTYVCSKCGTACRTAPGRFDYGQTRRKIEEAGIEVPPYAKRVVKNRSTWGSHPMRTHPLMTADVLPGQKQGPAIKCCDCAKAEVDAAAAEKKIANDADAAQLLADARERFPDEAAVRADGRKCGLRYAARFDRYCKTPADVKRIDTADSGTESWRDGPLDQAWQEEFKRAQADAERVLRENFPELKED